MGILPRKRGCRHSRQALVARSAAKNGRLLAGRQLSLGRADLSLRQPAAEAAADAGGREAHAAGALGHYAGTELHLRASEPDHQKIRPGHDLRLRSRTRRPGAGGQHVPRRHLQRDLSQHQPGRGRAAKALHSVFLSRRNSQPRFARVPGLDSRGRRVGLFAQPFVRGGVRQSKSDRGLRRRRRRGGNRTVGHRLAVEQVSQSGNRRRGAADPAPERLQDRQSDRARAHRARGTGAIPARLRLDAVFRRGRRSAADAPTHGRHLGPGRRGHPAHPGPCAEQQRCRRARAGR